MDLEEGDRVVIDIRSAGQNPEYAIYEPFDSMQRLTAVVDDIVDEHVIVTSHLDENGIDPSEYSNDFGEGKFHQRYVLGKKSEDCEYCDSEKVWSDGEGDYICPFCELGGYDNE